ncbi:MAG TPA: pyruvate kinase [Gammaproteobacteria bacterium]
MPYPAHPDLSPEQLLDRLLALREQVRQGAQRWLVPFADRYPDSFSPGATNLAHYLTLRAIDLRPLQAALARQGLSSLGRTEAQVLTGLNRVIHALQRITGREPESVEGDTANPGASELAHNSAALFGAPRQGRDAQIMVTLPSEAAHQPELVQRLLEAGMDCARINCAHDDARAWERMIRHLRQAEQALGRQCRLQMDLAGYKLRTGSLALEPAVVHLKPRRDALGHVVEAARIELLPENEADAPLPAPGHARLTLKYEQLSALRPGDRLSLRDARGKKRSLYITMRINHGLLAECHGGCYLTPETTLAVERPQGTQQWLRIAEGLYLGGFSRDTVEIRLFKGDRLLLARNNLPGEPAHLDTDGRVSRPAHVGCTTPEVLDRLQPGQAVWLDDGMLGGIIERIDESGAQLIITHCRPRGVRLLEDKGLNFPGADLGLPPLSRQDLDDLDFIASHADLVGFSFVESHADMQALQQALAERGATKLGIVAKIETRRAFEHLPEILLGSLNDQRLGIMIARGDLAVEMGGERLAEVQEEILWLCEAAHVPVIWATQVLESLAKKGIVSRPELTDAAMSGRADCVMLNKGPYILQAVHTLDDILRRMQEHQCKKTAHLRGLRLAGYGAPSSGYRAAG